MNIEEAIKILEELKKNEWGELLNCWDYGAEESKAIETLLTAYEKEKEKNKEYTMKINNLISQIESAIDFMKTDKLKIKVDMYQQKEEDLKLEIVHLKKLLKEE